MPFGDGRAFVTAWKRVEGFPAAEINDATAGTTSNVQTYIDARRKFLGNVADTTARDALVGMSTNDFVYVNSVKQFHYYTGSAWAATDAATLGGLPGATLATASTVAFRDSSGNITAAGFSGSGASLTSLNATQLTSGTVPLARLSGITNTEISGTAAIDWTKINKAGSSLADLATRSATDLSTGTLADARLSANVPLLNAANIFTNTSGNTFGASGVSIPASVVRDVNAGDSTNTVSMSLGNSGASQGSVLVQYTNAAAANGPVGKIAFTPRNNAGSASINLGNLTFTKTTGADTASVAISNTAGNITLNASGSTTVSNGLTVTTGGFTLSGGSLTLPANSVADAALSTNVDLLNTAQMFTAAKTFGGSTGLPAASAGGQLIITGGGTTPNGNTFYFGDGSGWKLNYSTRSSSTDTVRHTFVDNGNYTATGTIAANLFSGSGASLTSLNGTNISSGTVADARLSANVPLLNAGTNSFSGAQVVTVTTTGSAPSSYFGNSSTNAFYVDNSAAVLIGSANVVIGIDSNNDTTTAALQVRKDSQASNGGTLVASIGEDGNMSLPLGTLTVSADPTAALQVATKQYVDNLATGLDVKGSVRLATAAALPAYTRSTNVITASANAALTVDGVTVATNDRILLKDGAAGADNGIYVVTNTGSAGAAYVLTRASDANTNSQVTAGMYTFVAEGTVNSDSGWILTTNDAITLNTTALTFTQFTGLGQVTAGAGLTKTGNQLDIAAADSTITVNADSIQVGSNSITNTHINSAAAIAYSKLNLATSIVNADISGSAAIAYSKLSLAGSVTNSDLAGSIADTKLNTISTAGKVSDSALSSNVDLLNGAQTITALKTINITSSAGAENLLTLKVTGDSTSKLEMLNMGGSSSLLIPTVKGTGASTNVAMQFVAAGSTDSGTAGLFNFDARTAANGTISTRPLLTLGTNGANKFVFSAAGDLSATTFTGSGANLTALNGSNISTGTVANARTTGATAGTASTLVLRDGSGRTQMVDPSAAQDVATKNYIDTRFTSGNTFVDLEIPSGTINGTNLTFTLANTPITGSVHIWSDGVLMLPTTHYSISGTTITFVSGYMPFNSIVASYRK